MINEKLKDEISKIKRKFKREPIETQNTSSIDEETLKEITSGIFEKIENLKAQFDRKFRQFKDQTSTTSVIPVNEGNFDELHSFAREVNDKFKQIQSKFASEIENLKSMFQESQSILANVQKESELRSRTMSFNKPDSIKKNNKSIRKSINNGQINNGDINPSEFEQIKVQEGRIETYEDMMSNSSYTEQKQMEEESNSYKEKRLRTISSKHSSYYNKKVSNQIELLVSNDIKDIRKQLKDVFNMLNKFRVTLNQNSNDIQIAREKLYIFMRGEKSSLDSQNDLAKSIKQGIKQMGQHITLKELNKTFLSKFQSPKEGEKSLLKMNTNRALNSPNLLVSWIQNYIF